MAHETHHRGPDVLQSKKGSAVLTRIAAILFAALLPFTALVIGGSCAEASALWSMPALQVSVRPAVGGAAYGDDLYDQLGAKPPGRKTGCRGDLQINASNWARPGSKTAIGCSSLASIERGGVSGGGFATDVDDDGDTAGDVDTD